MSESNILTNKPTKIVKIQSIDESSEESIENLVDQSNTNLLNCAPTLVSNLYDTSKTNIWDSINQKNGVASAQVFEQLEYLELVENIENRNYDSDTYLIIRAPPSIIYDIAKHIIESTVNVAYMHVRLNYGSKGSLGIGSIGYRDEHTTQNELADKKILFEYLEKEYDISIKKCIIGNERYEKLLMPLVIDDGTFEHAETRMIIVKGFPTIDNDSVVGGKGIGRSLLRRTLSSMFSKYGQIIRSYLIADFYIIEYDNNVNIQLIIDSKNSFDRTPLVVSRFNDNI